MGRPKKIVEPDVLEGAPTFAEVEPKQETSSILPLPEPEPDEGSVTVYVSSKNIETIQKKVANGKSEKYVRGSINGKQFEVVCDRNVKVPLDVALVLKPISQGVEKVDYTKEIESKVYS